MPLRRHPPVALRLHQRLVGCYEPAGLTGQGLANGASVGTWLDTSGRGNNLTAVSAQRPILVSNSQAGQPSLTFDGTNTVMSGAAVLTGTGDRSIYLVTKPTFTNISNTSVMFELNKAATGLTGEAFGFTAESAVKAFNGKAQWPNSASGHWHVYCIRFPGAASVSGTTLRIDGVAQPAIFTANGGTAPNTGVGGLMIGFSPINNGAFWNGSYGELRIYSEYHSDSRAASIERFLQRRWRPS